MFCEKCGGRLEAGDKFCTLCGNPVVSLEEPVRHISTVETAAIKLPTLKVPEIKLPALTKKTKAIIAAGGVICIALVGVVSLNNTPESKVNHAIKSDDISGAYMLYMENFAGEDVTAETADLLIDSMAKLYEDCASGKINSSQAREDMEPFYSFVYETGVFFSESEDVLRLQKRFEYYDFLINAQANEAFDDPKYAILNYRNALVIDGTGKEAIEGLLESEAEYKDLILASVEFCESIGDFDSAERTLVEAVEILPHDSQLLELFDTIEDRRNEYVEQGKGTGSLIDNGWDYVQSTAVVYGYEYLPDNFFGEGIEFPALEFTSETEGIINLVLPDFAYYSSFTYYTEGNTIIILPDPNGVYPVEHFNGKSEIHMEVLPNGDLELVYYEPDNYEMLGFTTTGDIFSKS